MGVTLFICFLFFLLLVGVGTFFSGLIMRIAGETAKKRSNTLMIVGGATLAFLFVNWLLLYTGNRSGTWTKYVNTGKMVEEGCVYHLLGNTDENGNFWFGPFHVDGVCYEPLEIKSSPLCVKGAAVFSYDSSRFLDRIFGRYDGRGNLYAVDNAPGAEIVASGGGDLWCRADQVVKTRAWYYDISNYQWYLETCDESSYHTSYTLLDPQPEQAHINTLLDILASKEAPMEFPVTGQEVRQEYDLIGISTDLVAAQGYIEFIVSGGQLWLSVGSGYYDGIWTGMGYPLSEELSEHFLAILSS